MAVKHRAGKLAVLLHADVAGSTSLVHQDEHLAHERIQETYRRLSGIVTRYHGRVRELRGDALLAEFARASDAVAAALAFQADQAKHNEHIEDDIRPTVRVGIAMGEVVFADRTVTGAGVVLAQRMEQLAEPGGVCITAAIHESLPQRMPFEQQSLGEREVKGFDEPVRVYTVQIQEGTEPPGPAELSRERYSPWIRWAMTAAVVIVICGGGLLAWYQFSAPEFEPVSPEAMALPVPDKPSIAVLPFDNLSGDPGQDYVGEALSENIITEISRFKEFFVIARNSTFALKGESVKVVAEELGVRYVVEGSIQTAEDTVRVTAQLIDATSGRHLWAERYDRGLEDLLTVQDDITETVVATLGETIDLAERERILMKPAENLSAVELRMRARDEWLKFTKESTLESKKLAEQALEIDPDYSAAYIHLAWVYINGYRWGWSDVYSKEESLELAFEMANKAVELDPFNYDAHQTLAAVTMRSGDPDKAMVHYDRALELNPNAAELLADSAETLIYLRRAEEAVSRIERAIRLNPRHPDWYLWVLGEAQYFAQRYEEALASLRKMNNMPNGTRRILAAVLVKLDRVAEARAVIAEFLKQDPGYTLKDLGPSFPFKHEEDLESFMDVLRRAGIPESKAAALDQIPLPLPDKPSIVVLPFDNLSPKGSESYLADAITETLIATLGQVPELFVIARNSAFAYKGQAVDVRQVGRELGVHRVLEGSVQQAGDNIRVTAQLIDATTGEHLWAERYDRPLDDFFALQDEIALKILVSLQGKLTEGGDAALRSSSTENIQAYLRFQEALNTFQKRAKDALIETRTLADEALKLDPQFASPRQLKAWTHVLDVLYGYSESPGGSLAAAEAEIDSIGAFGDESISTIVEGETSMVRAYVALLRGQYDAALEHGRKTVELIPNHADMLASYGALLLGVGQPQRAVQMFRRAMRLSPQYDSWQPRALSEALTLSDDHDAAVVAGKDTIDRAESDYNRVRGYMVLAIAYADEGMVGPARDQISRALELAPHMTIERARPMYKLYRNESDAERLLDALRAAGLPE